MSFKYFSLKMSCLMLVIERFSKEFNEALGNWLNFSLNVCI